MPVEQPTIINMYIFANDSVYQNVDMALEEFRKRTASTLKIDLRMHVMSVQDYRERMVLVVNSGAEADLVFDAPWMNMTSLIQKNVYKELSAYFDNPALSGLKAAFPPAFLDSNQFYGGIYGVPIMDAPLDIPGVFYRKDLADKYNITIDSYENFRSFLETIAQRERDMIPMSVQNNRGYYFMFSSPVDMAVKNIYAIEGITGGARELFAVGISPDGNRVTGVSAYGDPEASYARYPAPYNTFEGYNRYFLEAAEWNAYIPADAVMQETTETLFLNGYAGAKEGTINAFNGWQNTLKSNTPGAELGFWPYNDAMRNREKGSVPLSFRAWNYLCVPRNSTKTEKVFEFLNWVFESQENNNLFSYGVKGVHWMQADDSAPLTLNTSLPEARRYQFPGYELTWNSRFTLIPAGLPGDIQRLFEFQYAPDSFSRIPISGFFFDEREVITELAQIRAIYEKRRNALLCGIYDDPAAVLGQMNEEMEAAGLEKVKRELVRQVQVYLDGLAE
jgi:putative aldouronate transport system substrate-binding protein